MQIEICFCEDCIKDLKRDVDWQDLYTKDLIIASDLIVLESLSSTSFEHDNLLVGANLVSYIEVLLKVLPKVNANRPVFNFCVAKIIMIEAHYDVIRGLQKSFISEEMDSIFKPDLNDECSIRKLLYIDSILMSIGSKGSSKYPDFYFENVFKLIKDAKDLLFCTQTLQTIILSHESRSNLYKQKDLLDSLYEVLCYTTNSQIQYNVLFVFWALSFSNTVAVELERFYLSFLEFIKSRFV